MEGNTEKLEPRDGENLRAIFMPNAKYMKVLYGKYWRKPGSIHYPAYIRPWGSDETGNGSRNKPFRTRRHVVDMHLKEPETSRKRIPFDAEAEQACGGYWQERFRIMRNPNRG